MTSDDPRAPAVVSSANATQSRFLSSISLNIAKQKRTFRQSLSLLRTRRFGTFCFASLLSNLGTWAQQIAQPWLLLSIGASSFLIGLDSFALGAPAWMLTLIGGLLADRADRRQLIAICQSIQMFCPVVIVVLILIGEVQPWIVIFLSLVVGITDALSMPSYQTITPSIVEPRQLSSALALNATQFNLSRILGPAIAGVLMASVGAVACFALNALSYLPFIMVAMWLLPKGRINSDLNDDLDRHRPFAGMREVIRDSRLRGAIGTVFVTSTFCGPLVIFCPVLVADVFKSDVAHFSLAMGAFGCGGLIGAMVLLGIDPKYDRRRLSLAFGFMYAAVVAISAVNVWYWGLPALLAMAGVAMSISNTSVNTAVQTYAPLPLRGQAISVYMLAMRGGLSLGSLMTGAVANLIGVREALLGDGALALAGYAVIAAFTSRKFTAREA